MQTKAEMIQIEELCFDATKCILRGCRLTLMRPIGQSWPPGFPPGELLSISNEFENRSYDPLRVLAWAQRSVLRAKTI